MKWIIAGGSGFIGRKITEHLIARGDDVVILTREASAARRPEAGRAVAWTARSRGDWTAELEGAQVVLNLAGAGVMDARWTDKRLAEIRSSRIDATRVLAESIAASEHKPSVFLSASAVGIYGMRLDDVVLGEDGPVGSDVLASICLDWEQAAEPARGAGVRVAHPRIGIVLGTEGGALAKMIPAFRGFVGGPLGSGEQWVSWVHLDDVVGALRFAAEATTLEGPFNVVAPHAVRMKELARALGEALGRPSVMKVPAVVLRAMMGPGAQALLTGQRVEPARLVSAGFGFRFANLREALVNLISRSAG